jgi:hypothetical protein
LQINFTMKFCLQLNCSICKVTAVIVDLIIKE